MTRVTQSMLSTNMLRNLNNSYSKMSNYQDMLTSGMKITRASDDPVVAVKGMKYRVELDKVGQYQRNINEAESWLDTTDAALDQVGTVLNRVKELIVQAANDTNTADERKKIKQEIDQIREQIRDVANTQLGGKFIFSGTKTQTQTFLNGEINPDLIDNNVPPTTPPTLNAGAQGKVEVEVFDGITLTVNTSGAPEMFSKIDNFLGEVSTALGDTSVDGSIIGGLLGSIADGSDTTLADMQARVLDVRADVGARMNRVELMKNRLDIQEINTTKQKSLNEDVDYAETITKMTTQESIHQAALSVGAKIIQQTLVDFIR
ncbi:MAG: flagellar hook-associated protein FlgL [Lysinibacillus sp.]